MGSASYPSSLGSSIQTAELDDASVTTAKIANGAITLPKTSGVVGAGSAVVVAEDTTIGNYTIPSAAVSSSPAALICSIADAFNIQAPSITIPIDGDNVIKTTGKGRYADTGILQFDFGSSKSRSAKAHWGYQKQWNDTNYGSFYLEYSVDGVAWTISASVLNYGSQTNVQRTDTVTATFRYLRLRGVDNANNTTQYYLDCYEVWNIDGAISIHDDDTATAWISDAEANPKCYVDLDSVVIVCAVALYLHADTTETEIKLRVSTDTTFTEAETVRTIPVSALTAGAWNYITFNAASGRYVEVYGSSGATVVLAVTGMHCLKKTESELTIEHDHYVIGATDTTVGLDGK